MTTAVPPRRTKPQTARSRAFANRLRTVAFQRCARWADLLVLARLNGDQAAEKTAKERLDEAINDACNRTDITNGFAPTPSTASLADFLTDEYLNFLSDTELLALADNLWNDPLAATYISDECHRRGLSVNIAPDENTSGDPWAGHPATCNVDE